MRVARFFFYAGGGIFVVLGLLHALYTFLDIRKPRRLVPEDPAVSAAMARSALRLARGGTTMWRAWVGFNFSHSLGVVLFGALCICAGAATPTTAVSGWPLLVLPAVGLIYLTIGVLYWFRIPVAGIAIATACLLIACLSYLVSS